MRYIVIFIGIGTVSFLIVWALSAYLRYVVAREVERPKGRPWARVRERRPFLTGSLLLALFAGPLVSWLLTGRLVFGLFGVFLVGLAFPLWITWNEKKQAAEVDHSAITFFHALHGLIRVGLGLPAALFQLTESLDAPFGDSLKKSLQNFDSGKTLQECLARFRQKNGTGSTPLFLAALEMAYRQGLPAAPLLERMLPLLESEREAKKKVESLMRTSFVQGFIAFVMPWGLALVIHAFQPEVTTNFAHSRAFFPVLAVALGLEITGGWLLWKISSFF